MIDAASAKKITELYNAPKNAWEVLFSRIEKAAKSGQSFYCFDEEYENAYFTEHRKEVAEKLKALGYDVEYKRVRDRNTYIYDSYHNEYIIRW